MVDPKKSSLSFLILITLLIGSLFAPSTVWATSKKQYFDYGPFYNQPQVLGLSFSVLENLPAPQIPNEAIPPSATGILPGNLFYPFEKAAENVQLAFTFDSAQKEQLRIGFAQERLSEAKTLLDQAKFEAAATALADYSQTVRDVSQNLTDQTRSSVEDKLTQAAVFAQSISLTSPPAQAENWTAALDATNKALDKAADLAGEPAIPDDLSSSIQSLRQNGLISEEESNKIYSFKSRNEVRDELDKLVSSGQFPPSESIRLDVAIASRFPQVQEQLSANIQVAELRTYQTLPQPGKEVIEGLEEWKKDPTQPPTNDIKPYLWYNRAQDLAKEVDLTNFSPQSQAEVARFYPQAVVANPTYSPPPSPQPSPSASAGTASPQPSPTSTQSDTTSQNASPIPSTPANVQPSPSASAVNAELYYGGTGGALPGDLNYNIKRWNEELSLTFTFDPVQKARLKMQQAERRLAEAASLANDPKKASLIASVIKDYKSALDGASDFLKNAADSPQSREAAKKLEAQAARHETVFEKGLVSVKEDSKLIQDVIKSTEDAMDKAADAQDKVALPAVLAARLDDLKAQGLILPEEADDLVRSNSRQEVREKIRKLTEIGAFPAAEAKKLDEAQLVNSPSEYNQLVEVRKVEELQNLRAVQADFAQTPTLKASVSNLDQKETALTNTIETGLIKEEDLKGRDDLLKTFRELASATRPINGGQFPTSSPSPSPTPAQAGPRRTDAVLSVCPVGATFKQSEGCVWADSGKSLNGYEQYKCDGPRQYYSFAARKCVPYESGKGYGDDAQPICPVGYTWAWQSQSCQTSTGGILPYPTPKPEDIKDEKEIEERSKTCPQGASYKPPAGCIWDTDGKEVYDANQYRCSGPRQYYSFEQHKCVPAPKQGEEYPEDAKPSCKEPNSRWSWTAGQCVVIPDIPLQPLADDQNLNVAKPFITPDSPFYFVRRWGDALELVTSLTPEAKAQTRISQAKDKLADSLYLLEKGDNKLFEATVAEYTGKMQELYNDLSKSSISDEAKKAIGQRLSQEAVSQNLLLQKAAVLAKSEQEAIITTASSATILGVDKAADLAGEPAIPDETKAKIEALPDEMISADDKKALLQTNSRIEARLKVGDLVAKGGLTTSDATFLNDDFDNADDGAKIKLEELKKLEDLADSKQQKEKLTKRVEENEKIVKGLNEFEKTFEENGEVPAEIRPYIRLTRIEEVAQTIRPDVVRLEDFQNRKDVQLAVATLQEEFRPTRQGIAQVADFRRRNPGAYLPTDLARIEALSYSLGVRDQAGPCYLPSPPFAANTPCPAPGAAIPIASYTGARIIDEYRPGWPGGPAATPSLDKDGKPLVYGQGPKSESAGVCSSGYHWMYDSGGWCMSNSGSYGSSYGGQTYSPTGPGYTPYSPYYNTPGFSPASSGFQVGDNSPNDGCPYGSDSDGRGNCIPNSYPASYSSTYSAPYYYGTAPTFYTTTPPPGTVPGTGPQPTSSGQCPSGYHWMPPSGSQAGWCMADSGTYVPGGSYTSYSSGTTTSSTPPPGGYNCGSQSYDPETKRCRDGACPGGFNWNGSQCVAGPTGGGYYSSTGSYNNYSPGSSYQYGCTPGYYWDGSKCVAGSNEGSGWSDTGARSQSWCQPPSGGCGSNSYWDYGSCYCRSSSTYYGGGGPSPSNQCQGLSCGGGAWLDYSTCSCRYSGGSGTSSTGSTITCYPPSAGCPGGWYDYSTCSCKSSSYGTAGSGGGSYCSPPSGGCGSGWWDSGSCSCKQASSGGCYNVSASSCGSGWYFDSSACTCRQSSTSTSGGTTSSGGTTTSGSSSGSCPSGYHWMSDNGGWCMSDGASGGSTSTTSPAPTSSTTTTESAPAPAPAPTSSEPAPAPPPSEPAPAPTTTESTTPIP